MLSWRGGVLRPSFRIIFKHFSFCKIPWSVRNFYRLSHRVCHTQEPYAWVYEQLIFWVEVLTQFYLVNYILVLFPSNLTATFSSVTSNGNTWKDSLVFFFKLSPILGMICCSKKVQFTRQHPSLGSIMAGFIDIFEILIPMPKFGQELSIYICLSLVKMVDSMNPKWEGCIVINSLIFVVVSRNILYCLNLGKNFPWTKPRSNKKNDILYQKTTCNHIHRPNELWKNSPCFRLKKNVTNILTILSSSAQHFNGIRHIMPKLGSKMIRFGLR